MPTLSKTVPPLLLQKRQGEMATSFEADTEEASACASTQTRTRAFRALALGILKGTPCLCAFVTFLVATLPSAGFQKNFRVL